MVKTTNQNRWLLLKWPHFLHVQDAKRGQKMVVHPVLWIASREFDVDQRLTIKTYQLHDQIIKRLNKQNKQKNIRTFLEVDL